MFVKSLGLDGEEFLILPRSCGERGQPEISSNLKAQNLAFQEELMFLFRAHEDFFFGALASLEQDFQVEILKRLQTSLNFIGGEEESVVENEVQKLFQVVKPTNTTWDKKMKPMLEKLLGSESSKILYGSTKMRALGLDQRNDIMKKMGIRFGVKKYTPIDDNESVLGFSALVAWIDPKIFFSWLLSFAFIQEKFALPDHVSGL